MALVKIALAGEGGQGVQSVAEIIAEAAYNEKKQTLYIPNFGLEQRGGVSIAFIQVSDTRIGAPKFNKAHVVLALSERAIARTAAYSDEDTLFVYDSSFKINPDEMPKRAFTMGVGTILDARRIIMLVTGAGKADILSKAVEGPLTAMITGSAIQLHPNAVVVCDEAAATKLVGRKYYDFVFQNEPEWEPYR